MSKKRKQSSLKKKKIFITAFGPFPGCEHNHTADLLVELRDEVFANDERLEFALFETSIKGVDSVLRDRPRDELRLHFGVMAPKQRRHIQLERFGYNSLNFNGRADQRGVVKEEEPIDAKLPLDAPLATSLDVDLLVKTLNKDDSIHHTIRASTDPGRYLCNYAFYSSLRYVDDQQALFIHCPRSPALKTFAVKLIETIKELY